MNKKLVLPCIAAFSLILPGALAQTTLEDSRRTSVEVMARITDTTLTPVQRSPSYTQIFTLPEPLRTETLERVVETADETFALMAVGHIMWSPRGAEIVSRAISKWSDPGQSAALSAALVAFPDPVPLKLARGVLERLVSKDVSSATGASSRAAGLAGRLLARSAKPDDQSLLRRALIVQPQSSGLWLARASIGALNPAEREHAKEIFRNTTAPKWTKLAVAAALSRSDKDAEQFVGGELHSYLNQFAAKSAEAVVADASARGSGGAEFMSFKEGLKTLGMLQFLDSRLAENLAFASMRAENKYVRDTLGIIAAIRWPQRLAAMNDTKFDEKEHAKLLAVIQAFHPELGDQLAARMSSPRVSDARQKLQKMGLEGVFYLSGWASTGF